MFVCVPDWSFKCTLFLWQTKRILLRPWILDAKESPKTALFLFGKKESGRTHLHLRWRQKCNSKVNFRKWMRTPTHSPGNFCHVCKLPTKRCYFTPITNFVTANIVNDFPHCGWSHFKVWRAFCIGGGCMVGFLHYHLQNGRLHNCHRVQLISYHCQNETNTSKELSCDR